MSQQEALRLAFEKWSARADASGRPVVATLDVVYGTFLAEAALGVAARVEIRQGPRGFAVRIHPRVVN